MSALRARAALGALLCLGVLAGPAPAEDDTAATGGAVNAPRSLSAARREVRMAPALQAASGIEIAPLATASVTPELRATGTVLDPAPLLDLRARYRAAQDELDAAAVAARLAQQDYERLRLLHADDANVSARELAAAEARWQAEDAARRAAAQRLHDVELTLLLDWGDALSALVRSRDEAPIRALVRGEEVLLLVSLPRSATLPPSAVELAVLTGPAGDEVRRAQRVGPALHTDDTLQGETWIFRTSGERLRVGMRVTAVIALAGTAVAAVRVPLDAVVWYEGRPWAYVRTEPDHFERRPIPPGSAETDTAFLVTRAFSAGESLVVVGAQSLLSEELRWAIPDEGDD